MDVLEGKLAGNDGADVVLHEGNISYTCILEGLLLVVILEETLGKVGLELSSSGGVSHEEDLVVPIITCFA